MKILLKNTPFQKGALVYLEDREGNSPDSVFAPASEPKPRREIDFPAVEMGVARVLAEQGRTQFIQFVGNPSDWFGAKEDKEA